MNCGPLFETMEWGTPNRHTMFLCTNCVKLRCLDLCVGLGFHPLGEIISGYQNEFSLAYNQEQHTHNINAPLVERPRTRHGVERCGWGMDNIAKLLANITISHKQLGLSLYRRPIETLCHDYVTQRPAANVGTAHVSVDLLNYSFRLIWGNTSLVRTRELSPIQSIVYQGVPGCSSFYFHSLASVIRQGPVLQVAQDRGYPGVSSLALGCEDYDVINGWLVHYAKLHVTRIESVGKQM